MRIREMRVESAQKEVAKRELLLQQAMEEAANKAKELDEYHRWRLEREAALYEELKGKEVTLKELDAFRQGIALLREKELGIQKELMEAKKRVKEREEELDKAREQLRRCMREREKIIEHKKSWLEEMRKEQERKQEIELEDVKTGAYREGGVLYEG